MGEHNKVHVKVVRREGGRGWSGKEAYIRLDVEDRHGDDHHFYVKKGTYLAEQIKVGDKLEIEREHKQ